MNIFNRLKYGKKSYVHKFQPQYNLVVNSNMNKNKQTNINRNDDGGGVW